VGKRKETIVIALANPNCASTPVSLAGARTSKKGSSTQRTYAENGEEYKRAVRIDLREPHLTEFAHFVEGTFLGQDHYWWIFGRECLQAMLRTYGFVEVEEFFYHDSPYTFNPDSDEKTIEGYDKGGLSWLQCRKPVSQAILQAGE